MQQVRSCGVLITRGEPIESFLLMRHARRLDLPKGHVDGEETDIECALRELREETGITPGDIVLDPNFRWVTKYHVRYREHNHQLAQKTLVIFLARLVREVPIVVTEHDDFLWQPWKPPHKIQRETIDTLLAAVEKHFETSNS